MFKHGTLPWYFRDPKARFWSQLPRRGFTLCHDDLYEAGQNLSRPLTTHFLNHYKKRKKRIAQESGDPQPAKTDADH